MQTFEEWADKYKLDDEYPTREGRRYDCAAAWAAALAAEREVSDKLEKALRAMVSGDPDAWNEGRAALSEVAAIRAK